MSIAKSILFTIDFLYNFIRKEKNYGETVGSFFGSVLSLIFSLLMFLSLLILITSLIIGVVVIIYRAIRNPNVQHFEKNTKKIAISTGSGFASSFIASMIGSGEGITVFFACIDGVVFVTVSLFGS